MYKLFVLPLLFVTFLYSSSINPTAYATLGDKIYNNVANIKKLTTIGDYYLYVDDINDYLKRVREVKQEGLALTDNSPLKAKKDYLNKLRKLSKENDYYTRLAQTSLESSMANGDSLLFSKIINSGLIDTKAHKKEILDYYFAHSKDINTSGVIQSYLDESEALKRKREAMYKRRMSKKLREEQKIKRLRERDKERQLMLEKKLDTEVKKKKLEIRKEQKEELIKSI
jgi:hypothetical protein